MRFQQAPEAVNHEGVVVRQDHARARHEASFGTGPRPPPPVLISRLAQAQSKCAPMLRPTRLALARCCGEAVDGLLLSPKRLELRCQLGHQRGGLRAEQVTREPANTLG